MNSEINTNNQIFIIRDAQESDYSFAYQLHEKNMLASFEKNWGGWNCESFGKNYRIENIRIIENNNEKIGYIDFKFKKDCGYVNNIQISPDHVGKGIGTYIMKLLEAETLAKGLNRICLKVFKDNKAVNLYVRLGYKPISEDDTSLIMEKKI